MGGMSSCGMHVCMTGTFDLDAIYHLKQFEQTKSFAKTLVLL